MKRKILVAEDEADVLEYLSSFIPLLGYQLETAKDGMEALAKINVFHPELLVLDIAMPKKDGIEVMREAKKHYPGIKVIIVTGTRTTLGELQQAGANDVLYKPIDLTVLSERIKYHLPPEEETVSDASEVARLLIVEDESEICEFLQKEVFEPRGLEVFTAKNADIGWELYQAKRPHIVVVDLAVPSKEQGYGLIGRLTNTTEPPPPKSVIIATASFGDTAEKLQRQGYPVFYKPMDYERLIERVFEACGRYGLRLKTGSDK